MAKNMPAIAPNVPPRISDCILNRNTFLPRARAASSSSRIDFSTRPHGLDTSSHMTNTQMRHERPADDHLPQVGAGEAEVDPAEQPTAVPPTGCSGFHGPGTRWRTPLRPLDPPVMSLQLRPLAPDDADDLPGGDRDDGQVVGPQAQRRGAEQQRQHDAGGEADEDADPQRPPVRVRRDAEAVGAGGHEADLAEVQQAGVPEVQVEADRGQGVDDRVGRCRPAACWR